MKKLWFVFSMILVLAGAGYGAEKVLLGDFENPVAGGRYDGWWDDGCAIVSTTTHGVTLRAHSLKLTTSTGGWGPGVQVNLSGMPDNDASGVADAVETATAPEAVLVVDYTGFGAEFPDGWCQLGLSLNTAAVTGGWDKSGWQDMVLDGAPHKMVFVITQQTKDKIIEGLAGWGSNIGLCLNMGTGSGTLYIDNVWLLPYPPADELFPHEPTVDQIEDPVNLDIDTTLHWLAAADPNGAVTGNQVNPLVVDQYVFMNDGSTSETLYYIGKTGVDPGTANPESQYGPINLQFNKTYKWAVVDAIEGYAQTLTPNSSTLANVDPNNLIGPMWQFNSVSTLPSITTEPVNARAILGATNVPVFSIEVDSLTTPLYQWFSSSDNVVDGTDVAINATLIPSAVTDTLVVPTVAVGYQRYYYCRVANAATVSGGGTEADIVSNMVTLVVERMVAQYKFENNFTDTAAGTTTDLHPGTGVNSPVFVSTDKVEGSYALLLNGVNQYVSLASNAYPKASFLGAGGIGGGMDVGSILCWVKATKEGAIIGNADPNGTVTLQIEAGGDASMSVRGTNSTVVGYAAAEPAPYYDLINDGNWHLIAATWDQNGVMRMYADTVRVQSDANPASFVNWMHGVLIGAGRPDDADYTVPGSFFGGLLDNLRVYNYIVTPETIAQEYYNWTGVSSCVNADFAGSAMNVDNTGPSYCRIDLADFAMLAENWLESGFYPVP